MLSFVSTVHISTPKSKSTALDIWQTREMADASITPTRAESPARGARARARAEVHAAILDAARARLAEDGADRLSLRAVARDVGMVSSAVYRYVASRDELLTALIIDAYDSLGEQVEQRVAETRELAPADRWVDAAMSIRTWAHEHPNDYALIYGTPIRGYAAPVDTVSSGTRVSRALVGIVRDAGRLDPPGPPRQIAASLSESFTALRTELDLDVDDMTIVAIIAGWTQLFGLLTFELFGQTRNFVSDDEALFRAAAEAMAASIGLRSG